MGNFLHGESFVSVWFGILSHCSQINMQFQSELILMEGIVPVKHQHKVFDNLIQAALESVKKEGEVSEGGSH